MCLDKDLLAPKEIRETQAILLLMRILHQNSLRPCRVLKVTRVTLVPRVLKEIHSLMQTLLLNNLKI